MGPKDISVKRSLDLPPEIGDQPTRRDRVLRSAMILAGLAWIVLEWFRAIRRDGDDVTNHLLLGRRFLDGAFLYDGGVDYVYPPFWAMAFSILAPFPVPAAKAVLYLAGVLGIVFLLPALDRLGDQALGPAFGGKVPPRAAFRAPMLAFVFVIPALARDLGDCLINTLLVSLALIGVDLWTQKREWAGGVLLGLAISLKCTPALILIYFLWKRQWKMACATVFFVAVFSLLPVLRQGWSGPAGFAANAAHWSQSVITGARQPDPSQGVLGSVREGRIVHEDKLGNLSLKPALARYLMDLPYGHLGRPESSDETGRPTGPPSPYYVTFLRLSPVQAGIVVRSAMLLLFAAVFIPFLRRSSASAPGSDPRSDPAVPFEIAAVAVLMLLLSPVTWKQHCVWALPAFQLMASSLPVRRPAPGIEGVDDRLRWLPLRCCLWLTNSAKLHRGQVVVIGFFLLAFLIPDRGLIGRSGADLIDSWHVKTFSLLALLGMMAWLARSRRGSVW